MPVPIACVVEGHGDVEAVPIIIRRIAAGLNPQCDVQISRPIRTPKSKLLKPEELERAVELAARQVLGRGAVFVLIDSDDDCPGRTGPTLLARARAVRAELPISVVLAKSEIESWFVAAAESIAGHCGLPENLQPPANPEDIRGAKEWLTQQMQGSKAYSPTLDEPKLATSFNLQLARRAASFEKFCRDVTNILLQVPNT